MTTILHLDYFIFCFYVYQFCTFLTCLDLTKFYSNVKFYDFFCRQRIPFCGINFIKCRCENQKYGDNFRNEHCLKNGKFVCQVRRINCCQTKRLKNLPTTLSCELFFIEENHVSKKGLFFPSA